MQRIICMSNKKLQNDFRTIWKKISIQLIIPLESHLEGASLSASRISDHVPALGCVLCANYIPFLNSGLRQEFIRKVSDTCPVDGRICSEFWCLRYLFYFIWFARDLEIMNCKAKQYLGADIIDNFYKEKIKFNLFRNGNNKYN